jgi:hypothetical protein
MRGYSTDEKPDFYVMRKYQVADRESVEYGERRNLEKNICRANEWTAEQYAFALRFELELTQWKSTQAALETFPEQLVGRRY